MKHAARDGQDPHTGDAGCDIERCSDRWCEKPDCHVTGHDHPKMHRINPKDFGGWQEQRGGQQDRRDRIENQSKDKQNDVHEKQEHPWAG